MKNKINKYFLSIGLIMVSMTSVVSIVSCVNPQEETSLDSNDKTTDGKDKTTDGKDKTTDGKDKTTDGKDKTTDGKDKTTDGKDKTIDGKVSHKDVTFDKPIKIANWNLYNYGNSSAVISPRNKFQADAQDRIILREDIDLIGLEEINENGGRSLQYNIIDLNRMVKEKGIKKHFSYMLSGAIKPNDYNGKNTLDGVGVKPKQKEMYGFIYNDLIVKPIPFPATKKIGAFYDLSVKAGKGDFSRSPYGAEWQTIGIKQTNFTWFITHANPSVAGANAEAENTDAVAKYFDNLDGDNNDLIFSGDTNVKNKNGGKKYFKKLIDWGMKPIVDGIKTSLTVARSTKKIASIDTDIYSKNGYYDKFFSNIKSNHIEDDHGVVHAQQKLTLSEKYEDFRNMYSKNINGKYNPGSVGYVHSVSDHDAVYMILNGIDESDDI